MRDQLGVDKKTKTKKRRRGATRRGLPGGTSSADLPYSTGGALQLVPHEAGSVQTPPVRGIRGEGGWGRIHVIRLVDGFARCPFRLPS